MYPEAKIQDEKSRLAKTSVQQYERVAKLISIEGSEYFCTIQSKSRARVVKAAIEWAILEVKSLQTEPSRSNFHAHLAINKLGGLDGARAAAMAISVDKLKRREGRIKKIRGLPSDWVAKILGASKDETPIEQAALSMLAHTGCRIGEISDTLIRLLNGQVNFVIPGAKVTTKAGQKFRGGVFPNDPIFSKIEALCPVNGAAIAPFLNLKTKRLERIIEKASSTVFNDPRRVSSSCFRNRVASAAKARGWEPEKIALLLGHTSERTQKFYGRALLGRSYSDWIAPISVKATTKTKPGDPNPHTANLANGPIHGQHLDSMRTFAVDRP